MSLITYLSSEGYLHDNTEEDLSNPEYCNWSFYPPNLQIYGVPTIKVKIENTEEEVN